MTFLPVALLMAAQVLQPAAIPEPVSPPPAAAIDETIPPDEAAAVNARKRLNAEAKARTDTTDAQYAAAQAAYQASLRAHQATVESTARAQSEYAAARAAYEQRQREIADWQACVDGDKTRCAPEPGK
ncbi:hypothetical protein [Sphingosinicella soli]|uniref:Multidrug efflux pump subunit AcrA (Membrane-fusion protein) n=1 Tax=Sphingosinicella soli TaxID=333708 RepID=A0A7W7B156_9SPHN|nr:hypothetical protein [Sphingosinicella soli]MBB4632097.1 multidrug efflux pump subunit AcrA (membrane-fusion protein) [Sphingosinicella soli]